MDIVLIIILLLGILIGYKRGLINVVFSIIGIFLAIALALMSYKIVVKNIVPKTGLDKTVYSFIDNKFKQKGEEVLDSSINLPESMQSYFDSTIIVNQSSSSIVEKTSNFVVNVITLLVLIIIYYIVILIIRILLNKIAKLPVLNGINKIGGAILGLVQTIIIILIAFTLISFYATVGKAEKLNDMINNSVIAKVIYDNNILTKIIIKNEVEKGETNNNGNI